jgi:hypothetical protein
MTKIKTRYPEEEMNQPSIMLLRSLVMALGYDLGEVYKGVGGYGGARIERESLGRILKENVGDERLSEWDRDMIKGL